MAGLSFSTLKARKQFLAVSASGKSVATKSLVLQALPLSENSPAPDTIQVGITVSAKIGKAVIRNRVKRRLRVLIREIMLTHAAKNHWYVLIGRHAALDRPYISLQKDLRYALHQLNIFVDHSKNSSSKRINFNKSQIL